MILRAITSPWAVCVAFLVGAYPAVAQTPGLTTEDRNFVIYVYENLIGESPSEIELDEAAERLGSGVTYAEFIQEIAETDAYNDRLNGFKAYSTVLDEFVFPEDFEEVMDGVDFGGGDSGTGDDPGETRDTAAPIDLNEETDGTLTDDFFGAEDDLIDFYEFSLPEETELRIIATSRTFDRFEVSVFDDSEDQDDALIEEQTTSDIFEFVKIDFSLTLSAGTYFVSITQIDSFFITDYSLLISTDRDIVIVDPPSADLGLQNVVNGLIQTPFVLDRFGDLGLLSVTSAENQSQTQATINRFFENLYREEPSLSQQHTLLGRFDAFDDIVPFTANLVRDANFGNQEFILDHPDVDKLYELGYLETLLFARRRTTAFFETYNQLSRPEAFEAIVASDEFQDLLDELNRSSRVVTETVGDGWGRSRWLGMVNADFYPWVYSDEMGWIYEERTQRSGWYFSPKLGWVWTKPDVFPYVYSAEGAWLYVQELGAYDYDTGVWRSLD